MSVAEHNPGDQYVPSPEAETAYKTAKQNFQDGQHDQGLTMAAEAIRLDPDYLEPYRLRLLIHQLRLDQRSAIDELDQILRICPTDSWAYYERAQARLFLNQAAEALADADLAIKHSPYLANDAKNFAPLDPIALDLGRTWREECPHESTVEQDQAMLYFLRSTALGRLGRPEEARADMRRFYLLWFEPAKIDEMDERALVIGMTERGKKLLEAGNYREAIQACSAALLVKPDSSEARAVRGIAYHLTSRHAKASADLVQAWRFEEQQDRTVRCRIVSADYIRPESLPGVFPDTPDGRHLATAVAEAVARDEKLRAELLGEEAESIDRTFVFEVEGKQIDLVDWVWVDGEDEKDDQAPPLSPVPSR